MDCISLQLGEYTVEDILVNLEIKLEFNNTLVKICILLPENYPKTDIGNSLEVKDKGLFWAYIDVHEEINEVREHFDIIPDTTLMLKFYFITSKHHNINTTNSELIMLSGLGKRALSLCLPQVVQKLELKPKITMVVLYSCSCCHSTEQDKRNKTNYSQLTKDNLLELMLQKYPQTINKEYHISYLINSTKENLIEIIVNLEKSLRLVNYYKNSLGFTQISHLSRETLMATTLDNILNHF